MHSIGGIRPTDTLLLEHSEKETKILDGKITRKEKLRRHREKHQKQIPKIA